LLKLRSESMSLLDRKAEAEEAAAAGMLPHVEVEAPEGGEELEVAEEVEEEEEMSGVEEMEEAEDWRSLSPRRWESHSSTATTRWASTSVSASHFYEKKWS